MWVCICLSITSVDNCRVYSVYNCMYVYMYTCTCMSVYMYMAIMYVLKYVN